MNIDRYTEIQTSNDILNLLSQDELEFVSTAEEEPIPEGEEYVDLEHPNLGVQTADADTPGDNALPRAAVSDETWGRILTVLETPIEAS